MPDQPAPRAPVQPLARPEHKQPLDLSGEFGKIRQIYKDKSKSKANFLVIGQHGGGKSFNLQYAPAPVLIDSFDHGGTLGLVEAIESGRVLADTRYEGDSASNPFAYRMWEREFADRRRKKMFDHVGTYVIDSFTRFAAACMFEILKGRGRKVPATADFSKDPDIVPELGDYNVHQKTLVQNLADVMNLPCNVVVTAHVSLDKNEVTGQHFGRVLVDGSRFPDLIPTLFDEVYFAKSVVKDGGLKYVYQTVPKGLFPARSRLSRRGILLGEEEQNLQQILKKAGFEWEDKPLFL